MKKLLLSCALLLAGLAVKAQVMALNNWSCEPVKYVIHADMPGACAGTFMSQIYMLPPGGVLVLDMFPGGSWTPITWAGAPPPPGAQYTFVYAYGGSGWSGTAGYGCVPFVTGTFSPACGPITLRGIGNPTPTTGNCDFIVQ